MDPVKGARDGKEIPPAEELKSLLPEDDTFSRLLETPKPLQETLDEHERQTVQRVREPARRPDAPPPPGMAGSSGQHPGHQGERRPGTPLPLPLQTSWQPVMAEHRNPEGMLLPRPKPKSQLPDIPVDPPLLDALRRAGLVDPVTGLRDPRMTADAPFNGTGWTRVLSETGLSATWRSPRDPAGTWQVCVLAEGRRLVETVADGTMQIIEERLGVISVTRREAPRFEADL